MTVDRSDSGARVSGAAVPVLATPEQIEAEEIVLQLLNDLAPDLRRVQAAIRSELAATEMAHTADGGATLDAAIEQWTHSLIYTEIARYRPRPAMLWATDDASRTWHGCTIGAGTSVYNPDGIFRQTHLDGDGHYEITGQLDPANRPAQLVMEEFRGDLTHSKHPNDKNASEPVAPHELMLITDRDFSIAADGSFSITLGGPASNPNRVPMRPGPFTLLVRDMLSDWNQRPSRLAVRRLDSAAADPFDIEELRRRVIADLDGFFEYWAAFPETFFGLSQPNVASQPMGREGGWGMIAGLKYRLKPGEALLVTTSRSGAAYTGFQLMDPWMVAVDPRFNQVSLNLGQVTANEDGNITYVISPSDPGVANWLDTAGLHEGLGLIRWQALPPGATNAGLLHDCRVIQLSELANMPGIARVSAEQRRAQLAARVNSFNSRALQRS